MKINAFTPKVREVSTTYDVQYVDNTFFVKYKGQLIPVIEKHHTITKANKVIYSLPINDKHLAWTKRSFSFKDHMRLDVINKYWSTLFHNQKVRGYVRSGYFYIIH